MVKLHLVGFSSDLKSLVFSTRRGAKSGSYTVDVNPRLKRTLEEIESRQAESDEAGAQESKPASARRRSFLPEKPPPPPSKISPKEIQALLREGKTPDEVARIAEAEVSWIERFTSPIIAERAVVVDIVKAARISRMRRGLSSMPVGEAILANLADKKVRLSPEEFDGGWTAIRREGQWEVTFAYTSRGRDMDAAFVVDHERTVRALDPQASALGWRPLPGEEDDEDLAVDGRATGPAGRSDPVEGAAPPVPPPSLAPSGLKPTRSGPKVTPSSPRKEDRLSSPPAAEGADREVRGPKPKPGPSPPQASAPPSSSATATASPPPTAAAPRTGALPAAPAPAPGRRGWSLPARRPSQPAGPSAASPPPPAPTARGSSPGASAHSPAVPRESAGQPDPRPVAKVTGRKGVRPERPVPAGAARAREPVAGTASEPAAATAPTPVKPRAAEPSRAAPPAPKATKAAPAGAGPSSAPAKAPVGAPGRAPAPPSPAAPPKSARTRAVAPAPSPASRPHAVASPKPAAPRPRGGAPERKAGLAAPAAPRQRAAAAEGPSSGSRARRSTPPKQASAPVRTSSGPVDRGRTSTSAKPPPISKATTQAAKPAAPAKSAGSAAKRRREPTPPLRPGQAVSLADVGWSLPADRAAQRPLQGKNPPSRFS
jgi:DUF3071 family protein